MFLESFFELFVLKVVGSDSGRIVVLEFDAKKQVFVKVQQETFGKSGCRRTVPGQWLAVDPKGRAILIGAVERQKFAYILNRDSGGMLTISSPLEAHKDKTLWYYFCVYSCIGRCTTLIELDSYKNLLSPTFSMRF